MTLEEAEKLLKEAQEVFNNKSCPAFQSRRNCFDCHSFYRGLITKRGVNEYEYDFIGPNCTCAIVTGLV